MIYLDATELVTTTKDGARVARNVCAESLQGPKIAGRWSRLLLSRLSANILLNDMQAEINVRDLIAPSFRGLNAKIWRNEYTHYWLKGGRGSTKSSFVSLQIVLGIINHHDAHAVCFRKYGCDLRESVYNQIIWAIQTLGFQSMFSCTVSPMAITYRPTGQKIVFKGLDDPTKRKSQKMPFGYYRYAWFEELEQYDGMQEIRSVTQSYMRGGSGFCYFYSYNPPQTQANWVNFEAQKQVENRYVHSSNYLSVPRHWLGDEFFIEAETLKRHNPRAYEHEYLGIITGTGGTVFENIFGRKITDAEIKAFCNPRKGIDWGYAVDPFAYVSAEYDKTRRKLYIYDEICRTGMLNDEAIRLIKSRNIGRDRVIADSAEPKSIAEFRTSGINIEGAVKGKDSVQYGIKWLQQLSEIIIDPDRCPNAFREFNLYEFEKNKQGEFKSEYPDKNNHLIDAMRYAMERDMEKRGYF